MWSELFFAFGNLLLLCTWSSFILVMSTVMGQAERMKVQMICLVPLIVCVVVFRFGICTMYCARVVETYLHVILTMVMLTDTWMSRTDHGDFLCEGGSTPLFHLVVGWTIAPSWFHFLVSQCLLTTFLNYGALMARQFTPGVREMLVGNFFCYLTVVGYLAIGRFLNHKLQQRVVVIAFSSCFCGALRN